jgi:hypothetical protein
VKRLRDANKATGKHRDLQRAIIPYAKLLNIVGDVNGDHEDMVL